MGCAGSDWRRSAANTRAIVGCGRLRIAAATEATASCDYSRRCATRKRSTRRWRTGRADPRKIDGQRRRRRTHRTTPVRLSIAATRFRWTRRLVGSWTRRGSSGWWGGRSGGPTALHRQRTGSGSGATRMANTQRRSSMN